MASIEDIKKLLEPMINNIKSIQESIDKFNNIIHDIIEENRNKCEQLEKELKMKDKQILQLELKTREKNTIFFGVKELVNENLEETILGIIQNKMKLTDISETNIEGVKRIGKIDSNKTRPVLVELNSKKVKKEIIQNAKIIRNDRIYIEEDFPPSIMQDRKILKQHLTKAKKDGYKVSLYRNNLYINGAKYTVQQLTENPPEYPVDLEIDTDQSKKRKKRLPPSLQSSNSITNKKEKSRENDKTTHERQEETKVKEQESTPKAGTKLQTPVQGTLDRHIHTRLRSSSNSTTKNSKK